MPKAKRGSRYSVLVRVNVVTDVDISAESWEQALEKAKALKLEDAVTLAGGWNDGEGLTLESIYRMDY